MQSVIEELRQGGHRALESVYRDNRREFIQWASRQYHCNEDDALEIFQQTVIVFYENVMQGKLVTLTSSLKTYLFSIGKNKIMELKRYQEKRVSTEGMDFHQEAISTVEEQLINVATKSINGLKEPCRGMLIDFYYHSKTMQQLAAAYGYKNEDTAKTQKHRCMESLRKIFHEFKRRTIEV